MPPTLGTLKVDPAGNTVAVDITSETGVRPTLYTTQNGASTHSLPVTISTPTSFYFAQKGDYFLSAKINGVEIANGVGAKQPFAIDSDSNIAITTQIDLVELATNLLALVTTPTTLATVSSQLGITPTSDTTSGIVVQAPSTTWETNSQVAAPGAGYGQQQAFTYIRAGSSETPNTGLLFRVDGTGGIGTGGGVHVATGLRQRGGYTSPHAIWVQPSVDTIGLRLSPTSGAAADTLRWENTAGVRRGVVGPQGTLAFKADDGTTDVLLIDPQNTPSFGARVILNAQTAATIPLVVTGFTSQSGDLQEWRSVTPAIVSRINKDGYFMTRKNTVPADGDVATNEMALWFDNTNGAAKLMVKAKQADGTVRTGSLALA